jgi:hypothetical protein
MLQCYLQIADFTRTHYGSVDTGLNISVVLINIAHLLQWCFSALCVFGYCVLICLTYVSWTHICHILSHLSVLLSVN